MLHRSFKPAKCKTALKLAVSRIKLLKNKRAAHMLQLRREVAQLLASGQERTARIRVEHVVREEKTMAAYDLLEVYLELIVARLSMIESQKNCPVDLKEAVTSVIFASPRCADLPELQDIRKHLQSKYGKEFSTSAIELRPGCGVSRLMIEKLSVTAPDAQTKTKILSAIALEHKIDWDPKASGENEEKPPEDLLNGPNSFLKASASQKYEEPPVQAPTVNTQKHDAHENPSSPLISQKFGSSATPSTSQYQPDTPSVSRMSADEMGHRYTYSVDQKTYAAGKQHWNMEFTDATSAAQAAAEAAERASMAARAAAELSSGQRILRQQSSESQRPSVNDLRNASINKNAVHTVSDYHVSNDTAKELQHSRMETEKSFTKNSRQPRPRPDAAYQTEGLETFSGKSKMPSDHVIGNDGMGTNSNLNSSLGSNHLNIDSNRNSRDDLRGQGTNANEHGNPIGVNEHEPFNRHVHIRGSSRSDSLKSEASFHEEEEVFHNSYSEENIFSNSGHAVEHENNFAGETGWDRTYKNTEADDINYFADEITHENTSEGKSLSHSTDLQGDQDDLLPDKYDNLEYSKFHAHTEHETAVFGNSGSDEDVAHKFDFTGGFKNEDPDPFQSPGQISQIYESPKRGSWFANDTSYNGLASNPIFAEEESSSTKLFGDQSDIVGSSHSHEPLPVAFDESDGEVELYGSDHSVSSTHESLSRHAGVGAGSGNCEDVTTFPVFDDDESQHHISNHSVVSDKESNPTRESPYTSGGESSIEQPSFDTGNGLNLGLLSGGFRNKGKNKLPYIKSQSDAPSLPADEITVNDTSLSQTQTFAAFENSAKQRPSGLQPSVRRGKKLSPRLNAKHYDSDDDSSHSEDELPKISIKGSQERRNQNAPSVPSHKSSINSQAMYLDSDELLTDEAAKVENSLSKTDIGSSSVNAYISRPVYPDNNNLQNDEGAPVKVSKPHIDSGLSRRTKTSTPYGQRKPSRETSSTASLSVTETQATDKEETEVPRLARPIPRKSATPEAKRRPNNAPSSTEPLEYSSNISPAPSKGSASSSNPKAATREDSFKKASHVHPKLPDFDTIAAHLSSLRKDNSK